MDYIIIALWGLLAGGLLFSGSSRHSQQTSASQVEAFRQEPSAQIEMPSGPVSKSKVVLSDDMNAVSDIVEQSFIADPAPAAPQRKTAVNYAKTAATNAPAPVANVESEEDKPANGALSFTKAKPKKQAREKKQRAISFKNEKTDKAVVADVQTPVTGRDTVIVFKVVADDDVELVDAPELFVREDVMEEPDAVEEAPAPKPQTTYKQKNVKLPKGLTIEQLLCDQTGKPKRHMLRKGESLTQIAQLYYADARFWPYVFEVNRHLLSSPDKVQADMNLYLPDPQYYDIDGESVESVNKAKILVAKYLK